MPRHVVVDGSNIATEGRALPSLKQLNEAVLAYMSENPNALITVVVDASFGHRIDAREVPEFDSAVSNNEIVAPPAGAIGRGDAFVLSIANKVNATILSNDSYQEFHGTYPWLFEEGRLVGGKPVPHIGWVFVNRLPVRGPTSRKAMSAAKRSRTKVKASPEASLPMPVPAAPPPGATIKAVRHHKAADAKPAVATKADVHKTTDGKSTDGRSTEGKSSDGRSADVKAAAAKAEVAKGDGAAKGSGTNDLLAFLNFVEHHQPGSSVNAIVESYSSHGAYVRVGDVRGYVPLSLMADPPPRSAREFMKIGESVTLVVESFAAGRRSVDLAMPTMATIKSPPPVAEPPAEARPKRQRKAAAQAMPGKAAEPAPAKATKAAKQPSPEPMPTAPQPKSRAAKKAAAAAPVAPPPTPPAATPTKRGARKVAVAPAAPSPAPEPAPGASRRRAKKGAPVAEPAPPAPATAKPSRRRVAKAT